ncbi:hypothetical protein INH39_02830 [Massilia violaceinigra]|uniref:Phage tail protein n=1 Tax=Massilia violaceinigra TaxID=2045208 RepID=A0ABY4ADR1_9BURK|nr:hypothetical protein [Massilia violaceinigra]UOD30698.1 hypothetical protein INH39_02830 [Massilia violaceinigra]
MSQPCSVLAPVAITGAMIISSTVPETDHAVYNPATSYTIGQRCISTVTHRIYESVSASANVGHDPTDLINQFGAVPWWVDQGPTNLWAMFDAFVSTQCVIASPLKIVLKPGSFNAVALFGLDADALSITVLDAAGGSVIYSYTGALEASEPADYYEYFFERFKPQTDFIATGLEAFNNAQITITLTKVTGPVKCGLIALGDMKPIGLTEYGAKVTPNSYSFIDVDRFGRTTITPGANTTDMSLQVKLGIAEANTVYATLKSVQAVPCVWIATDAADYASLRVFGLGTPTLSHDGPDECTVTLDVKGLI